MKKLLIILIVLLSVSFANEKMQAKERGQLTLPVATVTSLVLADTYYPVSGNFTDGSIKNFILSSNGELKYIGYGNTFLLSGVADIKVNKLCQITFGLYKNGMLCENAETPHTFTGADRIHSIAITRLVYGEHDDIYQVYAKSSEVNTDLTVEGLAVNLWGR